MTLRRIQTIQKKVPSTKPTETSDSHLLYWTVTYFMTLSLFLLLPALLSCLLHFLLSADTGGRNSRRGGAAAKLHPPEMLGVAAKPTMGLGVAGGGWGWPGTHEEELSTYPTAAAVGGSQTEHRQKTDNTPHLAASHEGLWSSSRSPLWRALC